MANDLKNQAETKSAPQDATLSNANIDLLDAAPKAKWETPSHPDNLLYPNDLRYGKKGDQGEAPNPRPKKSLNEQDSREFLKYASEALDAPLAQTTAQRLKSECPELFNQFQAKAASQETSPKVPRWADRKELYPDQKISSVQWIEQHYASLLEGGLTTGELKKIDEPLYLAYRRLVEKEPSQAIGQLQFKERRRVASPEAELERQREAKRNSYHRHKAI